MKTAVVLCLSFLTCGLWAQSDCELTDSLYRFKSVEKWEHAFNEAFGFTQESSYFKGTQLKAMDSMFPDTKVRLYFTMNDTILNSTPGLILVTYPSNSCHSDNSSLVLTASIGDSPGMIAPMDSSLQSKMENWHVIMESDPMRVYETTYGYNYLWEHLLEACQGGKSDLSVIYGISNINVENNKKSAIHIYLTSSNPARIEKKYLDFSRPCPQLCGSLSFVIDIELEDFNMNGDKE